MSTPIHSTLAAMPPLPSPVLEGKHFILASNSPRRRELLSMILPHFDIAPSRNIDETYSSALPADEVPVFLAQLKAKAYSDLITPDTILITADTVVICQDCIMGKPHNADEAQRMLAMLAGRTHTVVTGVCISTAKGCKTFSEHTQVHFAPLTLEQIDQYIARFAPFDKAGAYGIQEWIGAVGITGITGCFYNVMGLPLHSLYDKLREE